MTDRLRTGRGAARRAALSALSALGILGGAGCERHEAPRGGQQTATGSTERRSDAGSARTPSPPEGWEAVDPLSLSVAERALRDRATSARDAMFGRLFARLGAVLAEPPPEGGAVAAIAVCKAEAPQIAESIAAEHGVRIGRTGVRLRNPANTAPVWAIEALGNGRWSPAQSDSAGEARETMLATPWFSVHRNGGLRALLPIRLMPECLQCHGPAEMIAPAVRDAIAREYPDDQATGFSAGDLRGWFWVEVDG
ncbi:MAG TPA: DUF3365 domain-containing protein [Phycisphaerales bacterium]|nr:DUF3365 domain-containing protein [Phycisphaerales bacterium]HMP35845.1 DUF3365 domain-containing protein [Phycisphaerales bacterium]